MGLGVAAPVWANEHAEPDAQGEAEEPATTDVPVKTIDANAPPGARATLYAFFATWCVPCRVELPHIQRFHDAYAERGLKVLLVSEDAPSTAQNIPAFLARYGVTAAWALDDESELLERYNPSASLPFTVLLDSAGNVAYAHSGYEPGDEKLLESEILKHLAATEPVKAKAVRVTSTTQSLGAWRNSNFNAQNDGDLFAGVGRVEVAGETKVSSSTIRARVRVDGALVSDDAPAADEERDDARVERATLSAEVGPFTLVAGDDYVSFGHGVTLSLRKIDPLGLDTSLRGARVDAEKGWMSATLLAGWTNPQNFDPLAFHIEPEQDNDLLTGAELTLDVGERGNVAPYIVYNQADGAADNGNDISWITAGISTSLELGPIRVAAEAAGGSREGKFGEADDDTDTAWAAYGAVQWNMGSVTTLVDFKAYRHWLIGRTADSLFYHEPPTLEREDQEVPNNEDVLGSRIRVEWRALERATVYGNFLTYGYGDQMTSAIDGELALHGYAGGDIRLGANEEGNVGLAAGYRREQNAEGERNLSLWHVDLDGALALPKSLAVTLKYNHRSEVKRLIQDKSFSRGLIVGGLSRSGWGALSLLYGYSTEFDTTPTHYPAGELLVHLPRGGNVRLFFGRLSGGIICVSGTCRNVPPFSGGRLDFTINI